MINYYYDEEQGVYELYFNDTLLVELPYCDILTTEEAENLADELYNQYLEAQK
jgi:hypothetical protein